MHPLGISEAKLKPWGIYPGAYSTMYQVLAIWLRFELNTYRSGESPPARCLHDGVIDDSYEIDKEELSQVFCAKDIPLPLGLFPQVQALEDIVTCMYAKGANKDQVATELLKRDPDITNYKLGKLTSRDNIPAGETARLRMRGTRLKAKLKRC